MAAKVFTYKLGKGQVTFANIKKEEADKLHETLSAVQEPEATPSPPSIQPSPKLDSYSIGRTINKTMRTVIITVFKFDVATGATSVVEQLEHPSYKSNQEMRHMLAKYKLMD